MALFQQGNSEVTSALPSHESPFLTIWRHPRETIRWIIAEDQSLHVMWLVCLAGIVDVLSRDFARDTGDRPMAAIIAAILGACISGPLRGLLSLWIFSHLIRLTGGWIGGRATREHIRAALAWGLVPIVSGLPLSILLAVNSHMFADEAPSLAAQPRLLVFGLMGAILVQLVLTAWSVALLCQTVAEVQGFRSGWSALGNLSMATVLFLVSVFIIITLLT